MVQWDPNPLISQKIEMKRTALAIMYIHRVEKRLKTYDKSHKMYEVFNNILATLKGRVAKLNLKMLEHLTNILYKSFDKPRAFVDLTVDDDNEPELPQQSEENYQDPAFSPEPSPTHEISDSESLPEIRGAQNAKPSSCPAPAPGLSDVRPVSKPIRVVPIINPVPLPSQELPSPASLLASLPSVSEPSLLNSTSSTPSRVTPQRRKSLSRPSQELPSIATYKIKHQLLPPPSLYAKPKDQENEAPARNIITVPYKTAPRPSAAFDPVDHTSKLKGIKEKIYAKNCLRLNTKKKEEIQKELQDQEQEEINENSEDKSEPPTPTETPEELPEERPQEFPLEQETVQKRNLGKARMLRSKSILVDSTKRYSFPDDDDRIEVQETPKAAPDIPETLKDPVQNAAPTVNAKKNVRKRGRPVNTNIVPQVVRSTRLEQLFPGDSFEPFPYENNLDINETALPEEDDLLVEIPGKRKMPRKTHCYLPKRRNAVDTKVNPQKLIKQEPVED